MPFDFLNIPGVAPRNAFLLAQMAKLSYEVESVARNQLRDRWGAAQVEWFDKSDTQAFAASDENNIIIAFRGTQPEVLNDWLSDIKFAYVRGPWGHVHKGFSASLNFIWPDLLKTVKQFRTKEQPIWITGHSLGAALAVIASARLYNEKLIPRAVCTFGQPRVGNSKFSNSFFERFNINYRRFVNNSDGVANVPNPIPPLGYTHIGKTCSFFDEKGKLKLDYSFSEGMSDFWLKAFKSIRPASGGGIGFDLTEIPRILGDHGMDLYLKNLETSFAKINSAN